jgi:hypothetical protein
LDRESFFVLFVHKFSFLGKRSLTRLNAR